MISQVNWTRASNVADPMKQEIGVESIWIMSRMAWPRSVVRALSEATNVTRGFALQLFVRFNWDYWIYESIECNVSSPPHELSHRSSISWCAVHLDDLAEQERPLILSRAI